MYVKHLQEYLDKFTNGKKGNAVSNAKIFIYVNGYLEEIKRIEVHEHAMSQPGAESIRSRGPWSKVLENFFTIPVPWFKNHGA
jgi:hemerythrin-like domain-containing protein